jgi:DNA mismatch repair protein MutH
MNNEYWIKEFENYYGYTQSSIIRKLCLPYGTVKPKHIGSIIANRIIGSKKSVELFEANLKTIRTFQNNPMESMSFSQISYKQIINEKWEDSILYKNLTSTFLFVVYKLQNIKDKDPILEQVLFWKMNNDDLELASKFWELTKDSVLRGDYKGFISFKNDFICHVRTKGKNKLDLMETPQYTLEPKRSFWLNSNYIKSQIYK